MPYTRKHPFDERVVDRINAYIKENNLSIKKIAAESGLTYQQLYQLLNKRQMIKLREYVSICRAFKEPFEKFI